MLSVMIKPVSSKCNLDCSYCFYKNEAINRKQEDYGIISKDTISNLLKKVFDYEKLSAYFIFQGGEPTLIGIDFYKKFISMMNKENKNNIVTHISIQTNGLLIDDNWYNFFAENNILVGLSLDGIKLTHDKYRKDLKNSNTYNTVFNAALKLKEYDCNFNILTVVTDDICDNIEQIYKDYVSNEFFYQQYIPCINTNKTYLTNDKYFLFLDKLFDLYINDALDDNNVYIRLFDNLMAAMNNLPVEDCSMCSRCNKQIVLEADGSVFPCDFYCLDKYLLGNINNNSIEEILSSNIAKNFFKQWSTSDECKKCKFFKLCHGGCIRYRDEKNKYYYCDAIYKFLEKNYKDLMALYRYYNWY